ncbi:condensin complex subunit 1 [Kluyveromyces marxianus]|uniref:Condensin complex subunit 1 n=1 Tax=Kluyveromyces marxianus TaxID=4911 RepID=A0ABX6EWP9_KLUMA|nr:condensin complex subunit 1 [Kluyveromyces marxianus]BAP71697.1 condensin complex subunit 1 [Kluyveromyces marxianus]
MSSFQLTEYLSSFQHTDKSTYKELPTPGAKLNHITDTLALNSEYELSDDTFEVLVDLAHSYFHLSYNVKQQLIYLVSSCLSNLSTLIHSNYQVDEDTLQSWKINLQKWGYLVHVLLVFMQDDLLNSPHQQQQQQKKEEIKLYSALLEILLPSIINLASIPQLPKLFDTLLERDVFVGIFLKPLFTLVECEPLIKINHVKTMIIKIIAIFVKNDNQSQLVQNFVMANLTYFPQLTNFNAELLTYINDEFDYPQLTEDILRSISVKEFNAKDLSGPKSISNFLIKISELSPRVVLRQMTSIIRLLNNSSFTLRCSVVEACGNIAVDISSDPDLYQHYKEQNDTLLELLDERFQDSNPYVRCKAIQSWIKICDLKIKFNHHRLLVTKLAVRSLQDKSSLVRKNAVKLLSKLLFTHPYDQMHGSQLKLHDWKHRLHNLMEHDFDEDDEKIKLTETYYKDAITFIESLHDAIEHSVPLLFSRNKSEVLETMDFLVLCDAFDLELSSLGIKKMLHLVWFKNSNDEGINIADHLVTCYKQLFLTTPDHFNYKERSAFIAKNLINLTLDASVSDLASLERLIGLMYDSKLIDYNDINALWMIYQSLLTDGKIGGAEFSTSEIYGAITVLGMLALADNEVGLRGLPHILKVGFDHGKLPIIKMTCVILQRMVPSENTDIPHHEEVLQILHNLVISSTDDHEYYSMCEHAINAIFEISKRPDIICNQIIKEKTMITFGELRNKEGEDSTNQKSLGSRLTSLSQLLFIVGQVCIKIIIFLEKSEAEFKKTKIQYESLKSATNENTTTDADNSMANTSEQQKELDLIGGTNEDDFSDAIQYIKENELLFGPNSLLAKYGPLVEEIVTNYDKFNDKYLQRNAVLCLTKMMCVSSRFCEKNLSLLITIMERSPDPIIRSNAVLGLGDMAVCFNNLIDENTDFLYRRLHDDNLMVQKTCLMTVTFLILAGQVKIKGQIAQMAVLLDNPDQSISDMCKLFFTELSTKDNAIYNGFIDIFSGLSSDEELPNDSFKTIIKYLLTFIDKDRHQKQLSEKLLSRILKAETQRQWDDIAFVLNQLPNKSEKVQQVLDEGFKLVSARD